MQKVVLGIIGHPVAHSLSPFMHNTAAGELGLDFVYTAFDVTPEELGRAMDGIRALGIAGLNVTVPHKENVINFLDGLDEEAELIGAVNTIYMRKGKLLGFNTDGIGFMRSLKADGFRPRDKRAAMIGAGGSSRAVGVSLLRAGVSQLTVINRTPSRGKELVRRLTPLGSVSFAVSSSPDARAAINESDLVVQTTTLGMRKSDPLPVRGVEFRNGQYVCDIIYAPLETRLLKKAKIGGARTINGLGMLLYQGSESFRIWTGRRFPEEKVFRRLKKFLSKGM